MKFAILAALASVSAINISTSGCKSGDKITVNYTGRLMNGDVFDSNNDGSFGFNLGQSQVIPCWDENLA